MSDFVSNYWAEQMAIKAAYGELDEYLSMRAFRALWYILSAQGRKVTPETVAGLRAGQLLMQQNFGRKSLVDVERWLSIYGRRLGDSMPPRFKVSLHTTEGEPCSSSGSMRLLADALDVLHQ